MADKLGKIIKEEQPNPNQYPPQPVGVPPQYNYPTQQQSYPPQGYPQPPPQQYPYQPMPPARPMIQGDLLKLEKITQDKKDWVVVEIIIEEKFAQGLRIGKAFVTQ